MALTASWVQSPNRVAAVFDKIRDGQAPSAVSQQLLKDWGFTSSSDRAFIPLLKALGFLSGTGQPTQRYHDYRDHSRSKSVMAAALKEAYGDLFLIKAKPTKADAAAITGKFKSFHNASEDVAQRMSKTFFALLDLADLHAIEGRPASQSEDSEVELGKQPALPLQPSGPAQLSGLYYNIQIHLPATKEVEVYNAIFKSLREHFVV
jgi:hypothetical protein